MGYRIKTISDITGIPKSTLLAWERRYDVVHPDRATNGYRVYSERDLALLQELKRLIDAGYKVSEAITMLDQPAEPGPVVVGEDVPEQLQADLLAALLAFDRDAATELTDSLHYWSYSQLIDDLFFPILREIGDGWAEGRVSVVQEHFSSSFLRTQLSAMLLRLGCGPADGPHAVLGGFPGEQHELGLLGLAIKLALRGWRVTYLGADVPLESLSRFLEEQRPVMLIVSVHQTTQQHRLVTFARLLSKARPEHTRVIIGGRGLPDGRMTGVEGVEWMRRTEELLAGHSAASR
ncbi:MAG: MerR family transcriptional regulator [Alphaproteobacteria bacterium]|nr:MerR family transcriptional regulator [Alphaproteobacteria bacterium]